MIPASSQTKRLVGYTLIASNSLRACSGLYIQTTSVRINKITGISRKAAANDPVVSRKYTETKGHNTKPTKTATAHEKPLPTPRMRVGYISAVYVVTGPQTPRKPQPHAKPKIHNAILLSAKIQIVMNTAASINRIAAPPAETIDYPAAEPQTGGPE